MLHKCYKAAVTGRPLSFPISQSKANVRSWTWAKQPDPLTPWQLTSSRPASCRRFSTKREMEWFETIQQKVADFGFMLASSNNHADNPGILWNYIFQHQSTNCASEFPQIWTSACCFHSLAGRALQRESSRAVGRGNLGKNTELSRCSQRNPVQQIESKNITANKRWKSQIKACKSSNFVKRVGVGSWSWWRD